MRKKDFKKKLSLNRRTIANLNPTELKNAKGGDTEYNTVCYPHSCDPTCDPQQTCCDTCECHTNVPFCTMTVGTYCTWDYCS